MGPCEPQPQSQVIAGCLPPDSSPSFSIPHPLHAGALLSRSALGACWLPLPLGLGPSSSGSATVWLDSRGSGSSQVHSGASELPLHSTRARLGLSPLGSGSPATVWLDSSVVGPAPAKVHGVWGLLAPAPSESDSGTARPSPDHPQSEWRGGSGGWGIANTGTVLPKRAKANHVEAHSFRLPIDVVDNYFAANGNSSSAMP
jgi:hypothetical protein